MRLNSPEIEKELKRRGDGWHYEDRPVGDGETRGIFYKNDHTDSCVKTKNGWICNPICPVEENKSSNALTKTIEIPLSISKEIKKLRLFSYEYKVFKKQRLQTFIDGRCYTSHMRFPVYQEFNTVEILNGKAKTKYGAKKAMINALDNSIPEYNL
jgi:hypothetical protein